MLPDGRQAEQAVGRQPLDVYHVAARNAGIVAENRVEDVVVALPQRDILRQDEIEPRGVLVPVALGDDGVGIAAQQHGGHHRRAQRHAVHLGVRLVEQPGDRMVVVHAAAVRVALLDMQRKRRKRIGEEPDTRPDGRNLHGEVVVDIRLTPRRAGDSSPADDDRQPCPCGGPRRHVLPESHRLRFSHRKVQTLFPQKRLTTLTFRG